MKTKFLIWPVFLVGFLIFCCVNLNAENIDPYNNGSQYAYGANVGWLNFEPNTDDPNAGAMVSRDGLTGYVWVPNIGWVSLSCSNTNSCGRVSYGVVNDGNGNLSGYAWNANAGWISFSCENTESCERVNYGVTIDSIGNFNGWAYGENIGWVNFNSADLFGYNVKVCKVTFEDLANFVDDWLKSGSGLPGDLSGNDEVDFVDYSIFADYWLGYCPDEWPLR
jgi:hypothetical protein